MNPCAAGGTNKAILIQPLTFNSMNAPRTGFQVSASTLLGAFAALAVTSSALFAQIQHTAVPALVPDTAVFNAPVDGPRDQPRVTSKVESLGMWQERSAQGIKHVPLGAVKIGSVNVIDDPVTLRERDEAAVPQVLVTSGGSAMVALAGDQMSARIRNSSGADREQVLREIDARLNASTNALSTMRRKYVAEDDLKTATDNLDVHAKMLRRSLNAARQSSPAEWESVRGFLAEEYEAYASSVMDVQLLVKPDTN